MQRVATTVIGLVGGPSTERLRACALAVGGAANVRAVLPDPDLAPLDRAAAAWGEVVGTHIPYVVHDADPLADVAAAWIDRWDAVGDTGRLEVSIQAVLARWRGRSVELPDYYLVVDGESLPATARHWYLGVLADAAAHRVAVAAADPEAIAHAITGLRAGRWWPDLDELLVAVDRRVPDALRLPDEQRVADTEPGLVTPTGTRPAPGATGDRR